MGGLLRFYPCLNGQKKLQQLICVEQLRRSLGQHDVGDKAAIVAKLMDLYRRLVPLGRLGTAQESAHAIDFLCSERASFINGQCLFLDGGVSVVWQEEVAKTFAGP